MWAARSPSLGLSASDGQAGGPLISDRGGIRAETRIDFDGHPVFSTGQSIGEPLFEEVMKLKAKFDFERVGEWGGMRDTEALSICTCRCV